MAKICPSCKQEKPAEAFGTHESKGEVRQQAWCKACRSDPAMGKRRLAEIHAGKP